MKGSDLLVATLENEGVERIVGVPGEENLVSPAAIPTLVRDAFRVATEERPGPVHLELPGAAGAAASDRNPGRAPRVQRTEDLVPTLRADKEIRVRARSVAAIALPLALWLAVPCHLNAQPPAPPSNPAATADVGTLPDMHHTYRGRVPFLDRDAPLPEGDWTVISTYRSLYRDGPPTGGVALLRRQGNVLTGLIRMDGNKVPRETALPVSRVCTATGVIWTDMRAAEPGGVQDCVLINFDRTAVWRDIDAPPAFRAIVQSLDDYSVTPPPVMVGAVIFVANARYSLFAELLLNPDLAGIAPDLTTHRSQSDWASFNLSRDPHKQAYVERLKAWSVGWRNVLKTVINGEQTTVPPDVAATP